MTWYTFSLPKTDLARYDAAHDLFSTLYVAKGLPQGMALWVKCGPASNENAFYAQIPDGMNVKDEVFFRTFSPQECTGPSKIGLSMLIGNIGGR